MSAKVTPFARAILSPCQQALNGLGLKISEANKFRHSDENQSSVVP